MQPRTHLALGFTLGLHLLAALLWLHDVRQRPPAPQHVVSILLTSIARPVPRPLPDPASIALRPRRVAPAITNTAAVPEPGLVPLAPTAPPAPAQPEDAGAPVAAEPSGPSFTLDLLKRQGHRIVRDMSREEPIVPVEADTPWARFRRHLEDAHVERGAGVQQDSYTSPDGTIVYRKRVGNRTMCRTSGGTGGGTAAGVRSGGDAGWIPCPGGVTWKRDP